MLFCKTARSLRGSGSIPPRSASRRTSAASRTWPILASASAGVLGGYGGPVEPSGRIAKARDRRDSSLRRRLCWGHMPPIGWRRVELNPAAPVARTRAAPADGSPEVPPVLGNCGVRCRNPSQVRGLSRGRVASGPVTGRCSRAKDTPGGPAAGARAVKCLRPVDGSRPRRCANEVPRTTAYVSTLVADNAKCSGP